MAWRVKSTRSMRALRKMSLGKSPLFLLSITCVSIPCSLRHEKDPYLGFVDCAKSIITEEGWGALYRAWWITLLSGVASALATAAPAMSA